MSSKIVVSPSGQTGFDRQMPVRLFVVIAFGALLYSQVFSTWENYSFVDILLSGVLYLLTLILLIIVGRSDVLAFRRTGWALSFAPLSLLLLLTTGLFITSYALTKADQKPILIAGFVESTISHSWMEFRKDGTYMHYEWCMGKETTRGRYAIKDSVLTILSAKGKAGFLKSNRFVIRGDGKPNSYGYSYSITHKDSAGNDTFPYFAVRPEWYHLNEIH